MRTAPSKRHRSFVDSGDDLGDSGYGSDRYEHDEPCLGVPVDYRGDLTPESGALGCDVRHNQVPHHTGHFSI